MLLNKRNKIVLQSKMDTLTDLYNKRSFWELLEPVLKQYLERDSAERSSRCELSRKLRIYVTELENGQSQFC